MPAGITASDDKLLQSRLLAYADAQRYRIGVNYQTLPINMPKCPFHNNADKGHMSMMDKTEEVCLSLLPPVASFLTCIMVPSATQLDPSILLNKQTGRQMDHALPGDTGTACSASASSHQQQHLRQFAPVLQPCHSCLICVWTLQLLQRLQICSTLGCLLCSLTPAAHKCGQLACA